MRLAEIALLLPLLSPCLLLTSDFTLRFFDVICFAVSSEPAIAICMPMNNNTAAASAKSGFLNGTGLLVGVTCAGLYTSAMSAKLLDVVEGDSVAFVRDRSTGLLIAAATSPEDYYDSSSFSYYEASASPNALIAWASQRLSSFNDSTTGLWPTALTTVLTNYTNDTGLSYFVNVDSYAHNSLNLDLVTVQKVSCSKGYAIDTKTLICAQCASPVTSSGGAGSCDQCEAGVVARFFLLRRSSRDLNPPLFNHKEDHSIPCVLDIFWQAISCTIAIARSARKAQSAKEVTRCLQT